MALRLTTWIGLTVAGCLVAALALLPSAKMDSSMAFVRPASPVQEVAGRLRRAYNLHWALATRDVVMRRVPGPTTNDRLVVYVEPGLPAALRVGLLRALEPARSRFQQAGDGARVVVAVVADTVERRPELPVRWYGAMAVDVQLPEATDGRTCLVIVSLDRLGTMRLRDAMPHDSILARSFWWPSRPGAYSSSLLGPCAYFGAFGAPGRTVKTWLESADFRPAHEVRWLHGASAPASPVVEWPARVWWRRTWRGFGFEPKLEGCAAGQRERCRDAVFTPVGPEHWWYRREFDVAGELSVPGLLNMGRLRRLVGHGLGDVGDRYLSDLIEDAGPERFARFWTSDAPVETAFAEATGISIEEWTMRWARRHLGPVPRGPTPSPTSAVLALFAAALVAAGAAAYAQRREVD